MIETGVVLINNQRYLRPVIDVAHVKHNGATCTMRSEELLDFLSDGGEYSVRLAKMPLKDFEAPPEFMGF